MSIIDLNHNKNSKFTSFLNYLMFKTVMEWLQNAHAREDLRVYHKNEPKFTFLQQGNNATFQGYARKVHIQYAHQNDAKFMK